MWLDFLEWLKINQIGDLTGLIGLAISIFGFGATLIGVFKSRKAAERAEEAATTARDSIKLFDTVVDFTLAISILEEIKRIHRNEQWHILLDRYASIRKILVTLRASNDDLTQAQQAAIQNAIANISSIENNVEKNIESREILKTSKFNSAISKDIDNLVAVLVEIKSAKTGGKT